MAATTPGTRRTRIVCISDTHNCTVKLPQGHVLVHAGDLTNQGSYSELSKAVRWLEAADFEAKIVIAGNHDITLDAPFYARHGHGFHNQTPQSPEACLALLTSSPSITYLDHASATIRLTSAAGPRTTFTVFGSPYSPRCGLWAFSYEDAAEPPSWPWESIPPETDMVVTHTPPRTHCDATAATATGPAAGCEALRRALWRVRPRLAVCGHIHDGRGAERVTWGPDDGAGASTRTAWVDPGAGNNKLSLVDLTGRHSPALANDGSVRRGGPAALTHATTRPPSDARPPAVLDSGASSERSSIIDNNTEPPGQKARPPRRDGEARAGTTGRRETCVVNAAIMKSRHPHVGGKQLRKPIVVDLDLPVWEEAPGRES